MVPSLALGWDEQPPPHQGAPVDRAWQTLQRPASASADDSFAVHGPGERADQSQLGPTRAVLDLGGLGPVALELLIDPGHEQDVAQSGLNRRGAGEQGVRECVSQGA